MNITYKNISQISQGAYLDFFKNAFLMITSSSKNKQIAYMLKAHPNIKRIHVATQLLRCPNAVIPEQWWSLCPLPRLSTQSSTQPATTTPSSSSYLLTMPASCSISLPHRVEISWISSSRSWMKSNNYAKLLSMIKHATLTVSPPFLPCFYLFVFSFSWYSFFNA